jgi:hypothetical protein
MGFGIEPQTRLWLFAAVARETVLLKDGRDVPAEINWHAGILGSSLRSGHHPHSTSGEDCGQEDDRFAHPLGPPASADAMYERLHLEFNAFGKLCPERLEL